MATSITAADTSIAAIRKILTDMEAAADSKALSLFLGDCIYDTNQWSNGLKRLATHKRNQQENERDVEPYGD